MKLDTADGTGGCLPNGFLKPWSWVIIITSSYQEALVLELECLDLLEKAMATHCSTLAWKIPWTEGPGGLQSMESRRVGHDWATSFPFHFHALEKEMATHSSVLAWRIPGAGEPGGLPSLGSHRVGHDWSDSAAAAAAQGRLVSHDSHPADPLWLKAWLKQLNTDLRM